MTGIKKRRGKIYFRETDAILVFRAGGKVELSFPDIMNNRVPDHVMAALAISHALADEDFVELLRERFAHKFLMSNREHAANDA